MYIRVGYEIVFDLPAQTPMMLLLSPIPPLRPRCGSPTRSTRTPRLPFTTLLIVSVIAAGACVPRQGNLP